MGDALEQALRALKHRERSAADVDRYLEARGVHAPERRDVLGTLVRTSLVDDRRYAESRAASLASRGAGDDLIRHDLAAAGIDDALAADAIAALSAEPERAAEIVARRGASARTARYLAGKGFSEDAVHSAVAQSRRESLG